MTASLPLPAKTLATFDGDESTTRPMKRCSKCGISKPLDAFHRALRGRYRRQGWCKVCSSEELRRYREANKSRLRENDRRRYYTDPEYRARVKQQIQEFDKQHAAAYRVAKRAYTAVHSALKRGTLVKPGACENCGTSTSRIEAAHFDYTKQLDVRWLCRSCHRAWDRTEPKISSRQHQATSDAQTENNRGSG